MWLNSLAFKIFLAYIVGTLLSIGLLAIFWALTTDRLPGMTLSDRTRYLAAGLRFNDSGQPIELVANDKHPFWLYSGLQTENAYRVLDQSGNIVLSSAGAQHWPKQETLPASRQRNFEFTLNGVKYDGANELVQRNGKVWLVQLAVSSRLINYLHQEFALPFIRLGMVVLSLVLLFLFGICCFITLKYSLNALRKASQAAEQISPQRLGERLQTEHVPTEIMPLIKNFNLALERLEKGYLIQKEFLAKAAHELKTPLTLLRAEIDVVETEQDYKNQLSSHVEHLARHVQQLLLLAETSEPLSYQYSDVNVYNIALDTINFLQKIADENGVSLILFANRKDIIWSADHGALFTLLKNIIENALQHAPKGTTVNITLAEHSLCVRDDGPGVATEHLPLLFSRFCRGSHRRDHGAGLGLSICKEICAAHQWTISAKNSNPGLMLTISTRG